MASGKLGSADLAATVNTLLYTVPEAVVSTINVRFVNRNPVAVKVRLAIGAGPDPAVEDYLSYDQIVQPCGIIEDTGIACSAGEKVWAYSDTANISVRAHGFEE